MLELLLKPVLQFVAAVVPAAIRWRYPPERLATLVQVRLDSDGDGLEVWASNVPYYECWIVVRNASPFEVTLTGLSGKLAVTMGAGQLTQLTRVKISPGEEQRLHLRSNLNAFEMQYLHQQKPTTLQLDLALQLRCKVNDFDRAVSLKTTHLRYVNFEPPLSTWLPAWQPKRSEPA